ncbi:MAG: DEAD/DEAH box helicase [Nitrospiria bacterium]
MLLPSFHPIISKWFTETLGQPTEAQVKGWPAILENKDTLIAAPTGSGKTLAAFLACLDRLVREGAAGPLPDRCRVVYVSPLKALSNDIQRNLELPLAEIRGRAEKEGIPLPEIRALVRTGDTPQSERRAMLRKPPHIIVTTPESLYLLLTAESSRRMLMTAETVIVDEIHAVARDKRGSHLALSLERLEHLCLVRPVRIGLSATQRPMDAMARFLVGQGIPNTNASPACTIVDVGHLRALDLAIETPKMPLSAVCSNEQWEEVYKQIGEMIASQRSTLIFVNTRRLAERVTHHLSELLGEEHVTSHHGSLSKKIRLSAEKRLKHGDLKAVVATASLELGIDIGFIDLVIQIGSPRSIAVFLQRIGRSGHALGQIPKGRIFALTRDELLESVALIRAIDAGRLDRIVIPQAPLDILAQQIVAATACEAWKERELYDMLRKSTPYKDLSWDDFNSVIEMLSEGIPSRNGKAGAYLYRDRVQERLKARRGARITALTSGGAIPELADYKVVAEPDGVKVGSVDEDFAVESMAGDIFLLGNNSWRIQQVRSGEVVVNDAHGAPPTIPFWRGEAPSRTFELSQELSLLREEIDRRLDKPKDAASWLMKQAHLSGETAQSAVDYLLTQKAAVGMIPTQRHILYERFFDESGGMQMVIHAPFGGRVNRAYGLALRKRFCRRFDFELQASADDNGLVLSLGPQQGFPLEEVTRMIRPEAAKAILEQALLPSPFFTNRWRWNLTRSLIVLRQRGGKRVPPPLQRFRADDLLSHLFPALTACPDNGSTVGNLTIPDHPMIRQTVHDTLHEAMDADGWVALLKAIDAKQISVTCIDAREPSPFSYQLLNAQPYAFLDNAPLEERRARAVATRRTLSIESLRDLGNLDPEAIAQVRREAWPLVRDADELHDTLLSIGLLPEGEGMDGQPVSDDREKQKKEGWEMWFEALVASGRATRCMDPDGKIYWIATEGWPMVHAARPDLTLNPKITVPPGVRTEWEAGEAWVALVRGRMAVTGPTTAVALSSSLGLPVNRVAAALQALEGEGELLRGRFTQVSHQSNQQEWCARHLLARIHRLTLSHLRQQMSPISPEDLMSFFLDWSHLKKGKQLQGHEGVMRVIHQLQGFEIPAISWERNILPSRIAAYKSQCLDELSLSGQITWARVKLGSTRGATRVLPISLMLREDLNWVRSTGSSESNSLAKHLSGDAQTVDGILERDGALFFSELLTKSRLLKTQLERVLWELVASGRVSGDGFGAIRSLTTPKRKEHEILQQRSKRFWGGTPPLTRTQRGGRWWRMEAPDPAEMGKNEEDPIHSWASQLLERYGLSFRDLLARESGAPPWRELLPMYRRMEARGEIRGGRFITGVAGEQFALPEIIPLLRQNRSETKKSEITIVSSADPMNLVGILSSGPKVIASASNAVVYLGGRHVGHQQGKEVWIDPKLDEQTAEKISQGLKRFWDPKQNE